MTPSERLAAAFNVNGILIHHPVPGTFGQAITGQAAAISRQGGEPMTVTGYELADRIRMAERHVAIWQEAITNMRRLLDEAEPYTPPGS